MKSDNIKDDEIRIIKKREVSDPPKSDGPASVNIGNGHWLRKWWKYAVTAILKTRQKISPPAMPPRQHPAPRLTLCGG